MRTTSSLVTFRRVTSWMLVASAPLALATPVAVAQTALSPDVANAPIAAQPADPPSRVARLNYMAGTVTTEPAGAGDWSYASINRPLTTGDQLWNDGNARSELHLGSTAVRLGASTNLAILNLDDSNAQLKVAQGTLSTHMRELSPGSAYEIDTPNVALAVTQPGDYRVDVAPDGSTTTVTVRRGTLTAYGDNAQMPLQAGQQVTFSGTDLRTAASDAAPSPDSFDQWAASRDAAEDQSISARYVSRDIPGYQDLDANGAWRSDPQYGAVWMPRAVPAGWAPYHDGHWAWVAPWGWTWVDDAPWGFAPYHYGRWAYIGSSWAWVPGPMASAPPVYAPALVAFVGGGHGGLDWNVGLTLGGAAAAGVAWFPLGPGEVWRPSYGGWSSRYFERVNQTVIVNRNVNITNIRNTYVNYRAPGGVTAVPATAFVQGRPVAHFAQRVDPREWRNAQFYPGAPGIAPVRESYAPGLRRADHRPPGALETRSVVATRTPAVPAVYRDPLAQRFAQGGGQVPGAGRPVVRIPPPAGLAAQLAHPTGNAGAAHNVRIVERRSPVVSPTQRMSPAAGGEMPPGRDQRGGAGGERTVPGQAIQHAPMGTPEQRPQTNGVPRPQNALGAAPAPGAMAAGPSPTHREPAWTQPHAPISQQRVEPPKSGTAPERQPQAQPMEREPGRMPQSAAAQRGEETAPRGTSRMPQPDAQRQPDVERAPAAVGERRMDPPMQPRVDPRSIAQPERQAAQRPQRVEAPQGVEGPRHVEAPQHVEMQAPRHVEAPPQRMEQRPQPRIEEPRLQPQPRMEQPRPQPQPQHMEQPRPHPEPHAEAAQQHHGQEHEH